MRHRPVVTLLMIMMTMIVAPPAGAQQKPFGQDQWEAYRLRTKSTGARRGGLAGKKVEEQMRCRRRKTFKT
jgi:hypothetical protein